MKGVTIDDERVALIQEQDAIRTATLAEWNSMGWSIAKRREDRLLEIGLRIQSIDRSIARRKKRSQ